MRKLGFGCMRLPLAEAGNFKAVDIAEVERMVDTFLERGFTYFDTACFRASQPTHARLARNIADTDVQQALDTIAVILDEP